jgi:hypothetical protein
MKDWKTSVLGFIAAAILLATSKGYIDTDLAAFFGSIVTLLFGVVSSDKKPEINVIVGKNIPIEKDEK